MKIIDLLNKIANGEEVPKKIKLSNGVIFKLVEDNAYYCCDINCSSSWLSNEYTFGHNDLNEEIEILEEEKKIPEKIKSNGKEFYCDNIDSWIDKEKTSAYCEYLMNKYNDLIDYLKSKGE